MSGTTIITCWRGATERAGGSINREFISAPSSISMSFARHDIICVSKALVDVCFSWESKHRRARKPNEITLSASAIDFRKRHERTQILHPCLISFGRSGNKNKNFIFSAINSNFCVILSLNKLLLSLPSLQCDALQSSTPLWYGTEEHVEHPGNRYSLWTTLPGRQRDVNAPAFSNKFNSTFNVLYSNI